MNNEHHPGSVVFVQSFWGFGGQEQVVRTVADGLASIGWEVHVVVGHVADVHTELPSIARVRVLHAYVEPTRRTLSNTLIAMWRFRTGLLDLVRRYDPIAVVVTDFWSLWATCLNPTKSLFFWIHMPLRTLLNLSWTGRVNRLIVDRCKGFLVMNSPMAEEVTAVLGRGAAEKIHVIPNPVTGRSHEGVYAPGSRRFAYVGRVTNVGKRIDRLLSALATLEPDLRSSVKLLIVGAGTEEANLKYLARELGVADKVIFLGWHLDPWARLSKEGGVEALLLASDYEGNPQVLLEAMANGLPCIATDCPVGPRTMIEDGVNGFLVPLRDEEETVKELSEKMRLILQGYVFDPKKVAQSVSQFAPNVIVELWDKWLRSLA